MKLLYRVYQVFFALPLGFIATIFTSLTTIIGGTFNAHFWGYWPAHLWSKFICSILLVSVRVRGRQYLEKRKSYVFVSNHQGSMDIFLIYGYLDRQFKWMMKKSLRNIPLVGYACEKAKHIFVDKSNQAKIKETIERARRTLQDGTSLVVFPEGARTFCGHMGLFRRGAFQLAKDLNLPIVPLTINGSFDMLPRTKGFNFVNYHSLELIIHEPIDADKYDSIKELMDAVYQIIMNDLPENYRGYVKNDDQ